MVDAFAVGEDGMAEAVDSAWIGLWGPVIWTISFTVLLAFISSII